MRNETCFAMVNGYKVIAEVKSGKDFCMKDHVLVGILEVLPHKKSTQPNIGTEWCIPKKNCEPIASETFTIGEHVQSTIGTSDFYVTGFEYHLNRVVVSSIANPDDRKRYSYGVKELAPCKKITEFAVGKKYKLNMAVTVMVCKHPLDHNSVMLVELGGKNNGCVLCEVRGEATKKGTYEVPNEVLMMAGFTNVQEMK